MLLTDEVSYLFLKGVEINPLLYKKSVNLYRGHRKPRWLINERQKTRDNVKRERADGEAILIEESTYWRLPWSLALTCCLQYMLWPTLAFTL